MIERCLILPKTERFHPYEITKLVRFLSSELENPATLELFGFFAKQLIETVNERQLSLLNVDLDDPLIDLEMHDILDVVKIFSVFAQKKDKKYVPKLFDESEPQYQEDITTTRAQNLILYQP